MASDSPKRLRFDASAVSPADSATTPLATARQAFKTTVASLQPELATILERLANEFLVCLHKKKLKELQVKQYEDDVEKLPRAAKVNFGLQGSKLVAQDEEFISLVGETDQLVLDFRKVLKSQIVKTMKLEAKHLKRSALEILTTNFKMATKAILLCDNNNEEVDLDKFISTILQLYANELLPPLDIQLDDFTTTYKRNNTFNLLPSPYVTQLPLPATAVNNIPSKWLLDQLPKVKRVLEQVFTIPWKNYIDICQRNEVSLRMSKLSEEFFSVNNAEKTTMDIDNEAPVDPTLMRGLISNKVSKATRKLKNKISTLKKKINNNNVKQIRDTPSAGTKKTGKDGTAGGKASDTKQKSSGSKNKNTTKNSRSSSPKKSTPSTTKNGRSTTTTKRK